MEKLRYYVRPGEQTQHWEMDHLQMHFDLNRGIFLCHGRVIFIKNPGMSYRKKTMQRMHVFFIPKHCRSGDWILRVPHVHYKGILIQVFSIVKTSADSTASGEKLPQNAEKPCRPATKSARVDIGEHFEHPEIQERSRHWHTYDSKPALERTELAGKCLFFLCRCTS